MKFQIVDEQSTFVLSSESARLLEEFNVAACDWGWACDQGSWRHCDQAEIDYNKAKVALVDHLLYLENNQKRG